VYASTGTLRITRCKFSENIASDDGGALWLGSGTTTLTDIESTMNEAQNTVNGGGGSIYRNSGVLTLENTNFDSSSASSDGGCVYLASTTSQTFTTIVFSGCSSTGGNGGTTPKSFFCVRVPMGFENTWIWSLWKKNEYVQTCLSKKRKIIM